jgi:L-rhamnose-H+ transport protein
MSNPAHVVSGILLILMGAFASGSFGLFLKRSREWEWQHIWLIYSFFGMLVIPWALGLATVPGLVRVLASANASDLTRVFLYGLGWGIGAVLYGLALKLVGLALSYAIVMGLTAAVGSLAPLILLHRHDLPTLRGLLIVTGVALIVGGVISSSWAGYLKTSAQNHLAGQAHAQTGQSFVPGLVAAILSGLLSPMLNLSFAYGEPLVKLATQNGADSLFAANIIWVVALSAGFIANATYCVYLIHRSRSTGLLAGHPKEYGVALIMASLWSASYIFYGIGGSRLGSLAAVVGWPLMSSMAILSASFWGAVSGEWAGSGRKSRLVMSASVALLCAGMIVVGSSETIR